MKKEHLVLKDAIKKSIVIDRSLFFNFVGKNVSLFGLLLIA